ncbi:hypothetical protein WN943_020169 [Citrus x changshan-huyou]
MSKVGKTEFRSGSGQPDRVSGESYKTSKVKALIGFGSQREKLRNRVGGFGLRAANRGSISRQQIAVGGNRSWQQITGLEQQIMVVGSWLLGVTVSVSHEALGCWLKRVHGCGLCGCVRE